MPAMPWDTAPDAPEESETRKKKMPWDDAPEAFTSEPKRAISNNAGVTAPEDSRKFTENEGGAAFGGGHYGKYKRRDTEREITPVESFAAGATNRAIAQPVAGVTQFLTGGHYGKDMYRRNQQQATEYQEANPISYGAGAFTGEAAKAVMPVKGMGPVAGGAVYGGASGAISPTDTDKTGLSYYGDQLQSAAAGAALGAAGGVVLKGLGEIPEIYRGFKGAKEAGPIGSEKSALKVVDRDTIDRAVERGYITPKQAEKMYKESEHVGGFKQPSGEINPVSREPIMQQGQGLAVEENKGYQAAFERARNAADNTDVGKIANAVTGGMWNVGREAVASGINAFKEKGVRAISGGNGMGIMGREGAVFPVRQMNEMPGIFQSKPTPQLPWNPNNGSGGPPPPPPPGPAKPSPTIHVNSQGQAGVTPSNDPLVNLVLKQKNDTARAQGAAVPGQSYDMNSWKNNPSYTPPKPETMAAQTIAKGGVASPATTKAVEQMAMSKLKPEFQAVAQEEKGIMALKPKAIKLQQEIDAAQNKTLEEVMSGTHPLSKGYDLMQGNRWEKLTDKNTKWSKKEFIKMGTEAGLNFDKAGWDLQYKKYLQDR